MWETDGAELDGGSRPAWMAHKRAPVPSGLYGPRGLALRCSLDGAEAGREGASVLVCPYLPSERPFSMRSWVVGYLAGRRAAGLPMPSDLADEVDEDGPWPGDDASGEVLRDASTSAESDASGHGSAPGHDQPGAPP